jgi:hypothetical protein
MPPRWKTVAIGAFLLFHICAIASWALPFNSLLNDRMRAAIKPYMLWVGLYQAWDMFAPDPAKVNSYVDAEITFRDGSTTLWSVPRMNEIGYVDRYFKERYRKFSTEYLRIDAYAALWPDAARFIARANRNPSNPPVQVRLIRSWSDVNPPGPGGSYRPTPWSHYAFSSYSPQPGDLE